MIPSKSYQNLDQLFDQVMTKTVKAVEKSKGDIYQIGETARQEYQRIEQQLLAVQAEVIAIITQVDNLQQAYYRARMHLMVVNRDFNKYNQQEIEDAYINASQLQKQIAVFKEKEEFLRKQRDELQHTLLNLETMVKRGQDLNSNINLALKLLTSDWQEINDSIGQLQQQQKFRVSIIKAQEAERKRLARDIHDGPAQSIANIIMRAELCLRLFERDKTMAKGELINLVDLLRHGLTDVRKIILDLRPMALDDLGLIPALKCYLDRWGENYHIYFEIVILGAERRLDSEVEITLFRTVQEALTNIAKHANAAMALIKIEFSYKQIALVIKDDGQGFSMQEKFGSKDNYCFGLMGMQERVELLKGEFCIKSKIGQGTEILINLPLN